MTMQQNRPPSDAGPTTIRRAAASDLAAVEAVVTAAYTPYIERNGKTPGPMLDDYRALIAANRVYVLEDPRVVGVLVLIPETQAMLLDNIAVLPASHGLGYGRLLLDFAEAEARAAGLPAIRLYTQDVMVENIAIYQRRGYFETHRATERGLNRIFMTKRLSSDA
jgi:GNAT superfamily N-acetyltransferase